MKKRNYFYKNNQTLTSTEKSIIEFAEKNVEFFSTKTITDISIEANCSISSISKLARKLSYKNFKEMQLWFNNEVMRRQENKIIKNAQSIQDIAKNIKNNHVIALERTLNDLDFNNLKKIKKIIGNNKFIISYGIGESSLAASFLSSGLSRVGYHSVHYINVHSVFTTVNQKNIDSVVLIIFANKRHEKEVEELRYVANKYNLPVVLISAKTGITKKENELIVKYRAISQTKRVVSLTSKASQLYIADILVNWIKRNSYIKNKVYKTFLDER